MGIGESVYAAICGKAAALRLPIEPDELAALASDHDMGERELAALLTTLGYLEEKQRQATIETLLKLSGLQKREPKTFENFDFGRLQGRDIGKLRSLSSLSDLYARRNIAFIGPGGIGKTHLAQAYGRECCLRCMKAYFIKASDLKGRMRAALDKHDVSRVVSTLVKPTCLIIDEVGRCSFGEDETNLFFHVVDRRYEKEGPNTLILTSNSVPSDWTDFFEGDDALLCALDRIFDKASVYMMKGTSFRGQGLNTYSVESVTQVNKQRGAQPTI